MLTSTASIELMWNLQVIRCNTKFVRISFVIPHSGSMTEVVPIRIPKEVLEKIELLVRIGKYANKNEALRTIIIELLAYEGMLSQDKKISEVAESLDEKTSRVMQDHS